MPVQNALVPLLLVREDRRTTRLAQELRSALAKTESSQLARWGGQTGQFFATALARRGKNLFGLVKAVAKGVGSEGMDAVSAFKAGELREHTKGRATASYDSLTDASERIVAFGRSITTAVSQNPREAAPQLFVLVLSSVVVSGGPDGNGGAADLDLMFGIDAHRSVLSHSILMGAALEAGILSIVELVRLVHEKLPADHDALWDALFVQTEEISRAAQVGASLGLAYHLFVDGLAQPAPYKDLPIAMPMEAHQVIFAANAAAEAMDAKNKPGMSKFEEGRTAEELRHAQYRKMRIDIREDVAELMSEEELVIIRRYGAWMQALSNEEILPLTLSQTQFVATTRGERKPQTVHELAWNMFFTLTTKLSSAPNVTARFQRPQR